MIFNISFNENIEFWPNSHKFFKSYWIWIIAWCQATNSGDFIENKQHPESANLRHAYFEEHETV